MLKLSGCLVQCKIFNFHAILSCLDSKKEAFLTYRAFKILQGHRSLPEKQFHKEKAAFLLSTRDPRKNPLSSFALHNDPPFASLFAKKYKDIIVKLQYFLFHQMS